MTSFWFFGSHHACFTCWNSSRSRVVMTLMASKATEDSFLFRGSSFFLMQISFTTLNLSGSALWLEPMSAMWFELFPLEEEVSEPLFDCLLWIVGPELDAVAVM